MFCGIAWEEKTASDGIVEIVAALDGVWDIKSSGAITAGERVSISGANTITKVGAADLLFGNVGMALETSGGTDVIRVRVNAI